MKHAITSGIAALAAATLVLGTAGTAHAETTAVDDSRGDVWKVRFDEQRDRPIWNEAGSTLNGDVDKTSIDHGTDTLTLTTTYKRLAKEKVGYQTSYLIRTGAGEEYAVYVVAAPRMWGGQHDYYTDVQGLSRRPMHRLQGDPVGDPCDEITHDISYADDTVEVVVPRACFGDANQVKVKVAGVSFRRKADHIWYDNGHNDTHNGRGFSALVAAEQPPVS